MAKVKNMLLVLLSGHFCEAVNIFNGTNSCVDRL